MGRAANAIVKLIEDAIDRLVTQRGIPAGAVINQLPSTTLPPANATDRGGVLLSDTTPNAVGTAAAGTATAVSRRDHIHGQQSHNHTSTSNDGGVLTNDEHDGYGEYAEMSAPSTPAANKLRLYAKDRS